MSQVNTAPEFNPTTVETHFNQEMLVKSVVTIHDFRSDTFEDVGICKSMTVSQADWIKLSAKNKYLNHFAWNVGSTVAPTTQNINLNYLRDLIPVGMEISSFSKVQGLLLNIKPTANSLYQGLMGLAFYPGSAAGFNSTIWGLSITSTNEAYFQLDHIFISPDNSDEINLLIPINFPYEYFKNAPENLGSQQAYSQALAYYHSTYIFGSLLFKVISPLNTTSPATSLTYTISGQILGLETAGIRLGL